MSTGGSRKYGFVLCKPRVTIYKPWYKLFCVLLPVLECYILISSVALKMKTSLIETDYHRNVTTPPHYCSMLSGKFPFRRACCTYALLSLLKTHSLFPALWLAEVCLIKIPFSKLLLMAYVDLWWCDVMPVSTGKINRVGFLRSCYGMPQSQTSHQTSGLTSPEPCRTLMTQGVINAFNHHSSRLHHFRVNAD